MTISQEQDTTFAGIANLPLPVARAIVDVDEMNGSVIVHASESLGNFEQFRQLDALGDRESVEIGRLAAVGGRESRLNGCSCSRIFGLIQRRNARVQATDQAEDAVVFSSETKTVEIRTAGRTIAGRLECVLTGRRVRRRSRTTKEVQTCTPS